MMGNDVYVTDRSDDRDVQHLRKTLGCESDLINSVWGIGSRFHHAKANN